MAMIVRRAVVARPSPRQERSAWDGMVTSRESYESNRAPGPRGSFLTSNLGGRKFSNTALVLKTDYHWSQSPVTERPADPQKSRRVRAGPGPNATSRAHRISTGLPPIHGSAMRLRVRRCARRALQLDPSGAGPVCPFCKGPHEVAVQLLVFTRRTPACP